MERNEMDLLTGRTEQLIGALTNAFISTAEVAAERIALASKVAAINQRLAAFGAVLESIGAQKDALDAKRQTAGPAMQRLLDRQIEMLTAQETAVLVQAGVEPAAAQTAVVEADERLFRREGRRFVPAG